MIDCGNRQIAVEVKSGETVADDFFKTLHYWQGLPEQSNAAPALVYGGKTSFVRSGVAVYAWDHWG